MRRLRVVLFYILVVVYLIVCPLTVLYALGYLYQPGPEQGIVKGGLIYVSTAPPGASVYIGNRRYTKKTPTIVRNLLPGEYPVRLTLRGHQPWSQLLPVETGKATVLEHVLMLPQELRQATVWAETFEDLVPLAGGQAILLSRGPLLGDQFLYECKNQVVRPLIPAASSWARLKLTKTYAVDDSPVWLAVVSSVDGERVLRIDPRPAEPSVEDVTALFMDRPLDVLWDPREPDQLFTLQAGYVNRLDLGSRVVHPRLIEGVRGLGVFRRNLYVLRDQGVIDRMDRDGKRVEGVLDDAVLGQTLFGERGAYRITLLTDRLMLFLGEHGELLASRLPYRFVDHGVLGFEGHPQHQRVLFWQKDRLGVLDFSQEGVDTELFERGPRIRWVTKDAEHIEQAFWAFDGSHIVYRDHHRVMLAELETYGPLHAQELVQIKPGSSIAYAEETGQIYFLDRVTGRLKALELVPKRELVPFPFPERNEPSVHTNPRGF